METSKIKQGKGKTTYFFLFHFILVKMKKFFTILDLKQPNSWESILAVCKYSRRLLTRTLSPKVLSNDLSLWLSYDCLTHSQILIFLSLILNNFMLVSKSNSSVFKGIPRPIYYIDINTHIDRKWKIMQNLFKKSIFSKCLSFYWPFL